MIPNKADIVIVGSGIMGVCTAYYLALKGHKNIVVLDKEEYLGGHTTSRCAGGFRYQFSTEINVKLSQLSISMLENFKKENNCEYEFDRCGYLFLISDENRRKIYMESVKMQRELGVDVQLLDREEVHKLVPYLDTSNIICGSFCKDEGLLDPGKVVNAYIDQAQKMGVTFLRKTQVTDICIENNKIKSVLTDKGEIITDVIVNAAGPWAGKIGEMMSCKIPIVPDKQQLFTTSDVNWDNSKMPVVIFQDSGIGFHKEEKGLLSGMHRMSDEICDYKENIDYDWETFHMETAMDYMHEIGDLSIVSRWCGFYETTDDDLPIVDRINEIEGAYCIAGFCGHGFMHGPICGKLMSELITYGETRSLDISQLSLRRFNDTKKQLNENYKL